MKKSILINILISPFILFSTINIWGQEAALGCDGPRYVDEVFSNTTMSTVKYGEGLNYDGTIMELDMDVFQAAGDTFSQRPVVILAHSVVDDRSEMHPLCELFARKGYVTASMDYRGGDGTITLDNYMRTGIRQLQDVKAAVRFFRNDYTTDNLFRVDTNFIFVGGFSIGGVMSLHTGFWDEGDNMDPYLDSLINLEGGLEGQSNDFLHVSSQVQGVINLSGSILFKEWIDEGEAAVVSYHGTADPYVSIDHGWFDGVFYTDGSREIHEEATLKNIPNYFHPVPGGGHFDIYEQFYSEDYNAFKEASSVFFKDSVLCRTIVGIDLPDGLDEQVVKIFPNPSSEVLNIVYDGKEQLELLIYDALGSSLGRWKINSHHHQMEIANFGSGIYFYFMKNELNYIQSGKLIITNR